ncbi:hypothetical protein TYRP_010245 [Tyrophagus putrescentiae]|nr:hypothetical protein TYRP_010245 [Tyrophagus putrescentiae]
MSAPVELIELKRSANVREQTRAVKKFHDVLLGLVSKVYLDTLHFKGMVEGGNPPLPEELGSLVEAYDKANNMWNHIGKLKVSWATNVGSKAEYPALKDEDFNRQRLDIAQDFLNEQVEVHRRRVSQAETGYGDSGPIASTRTGADSFVDTMISTIRASLRDPGEGAVGNDSFTIPVPPIVSSSSAITSGPIIESAEQGDASGNVDPNRYNISISGFKPSIFTADGPPRTSISDVSSQVNTAIISTASSKTASHVNVPSSTKNSISVTTASSSGTSSTMTVASHTTPSSATIPISSIGLPSNSGINAPPGSSNTGASGANEQGSNEPPVSNENNNSDNHPSSSDGDDEDDDRYNRPPIGNPFPSFMNRRNRFNSSTPHPNRNAPVNPLQPDQPANLAQPRQLGFQVPVPDKGFEIEVFKQFYAKTPRWMSDPYMKGLGNNVPNLKDYLHNLDAQLKILRTKQMYYPDLKGPSYGSTEKSSAFRSKPAMAFNRGRNPGYPRRFANARNNNRRQFNNKPVERRGHLATVGFATEPSEYSVNLRGMYERQGRVNALDDPELQKKFISLDFKVGGQTLFGMLDTGASVNLFPEELAHKLKFPVYPCTYILRTPQGEFATQFATKVKVSIGCYEKEIEFLLYSARSTVILGMKLLNEFKIAVDFDSSVLQFDAESDTYIQLSDCVNYVDGSVLRGLLMGIEMNGDIPTDVDNLIYEYSYVFSEANKRRIGRISSEQCKLHLTKLGHLGYKQLELHFSRLFYNPHVQSIIDSIIKSCHICCRVKAQTWKFGTLGQIGPAREPFEIIHIDTKSGFKGYGSSKDNLHLAIDAFTRFVWAVSSKTKIGIDFINLLNKIIAVQKPKMIVADNYPAIKGKQFQDFLRKHEIAMTFVAVNHPSANGIVERVNRTIVDRLRCKRLEFPKKAWSTHVVECIDEYNNSVHTATRYTPSFLLTGSDPDGLFSGESLVDARIIAFEFSKRDHALNSLHHDSHRRDPVIVPGEPVYVQAKHSLNRGMLDPRFEGPFPVVEKIGHTTYEIHGKRHRRSHSSYSLAERENHLRAQLLREKRFVPLLIAGAIGGLISYGVMTSLHHYDNKGITDDTKAMSKQLGVDLDLLKRNNEQVQRYETMVNEALKKTWSQLDKVQIRFHDEVESSRMLTLALTTINEMKLNLERFFDSLILGKVSPAYNRLFPNNPFVQLSPLSYWTPHPCEFQAPNVMVMKYEVPKVSPSIKILEAEPFLILAKEDGKDCLKSYDGIKFIIWDTGNDCTRDLLKVPTHPSEVFLVQEDSYKCVDVSNRTQNWRTTYCEERVKKHQFVQMSVDEHFTYVYCYFHTLKVGDLDPIDCHRWTTV